MNQSERLIVSSGDMNDVDGFFALREYAKTGADVLFVMNYPAFLGVEGDGIEELEPGRGFRYSTRKVVEKTNTVLSGYERVVDDFADRVKRVDVDGMEVSDMRLMWDRLTANMAAYTAMLKLFGVNAGLSDADMNQRMKRLLTGLAHCMAKSVWGDARSALYFCVGGVNEVNPYHVDGVGNEAFVYARKCALEQVGLFRDVDVTQDRIFESSGDMWGGSVGRFLNRYTSIWLDFNGSLAFLNDNWINNLDWLSSRVKAAAVMGGVYSYVPPLTMPAIKGFMNRFSCSTMNQLYAPSKTAQFLGYIQRHQIPTYVVANNAVVALVGHGLWRNFLRVNELENSSLVEYTASFYEENPGFVVQKPYDFYVAKVLTRLMSVGWDFQTSERVMFYDGKYGIALLAYTGTDWAGAVRNYVGNCDREIRPADNELVRAKKRAFVREGELLIKITDIHSLAVQIVEPIYDPKTCEVRLS